MNGPKVEPINIKAYTIKLSNYDVVGKQQIRSTILGPSRRGQTVLLQNMIYPTFIHIAFLASMFSM